MPGDPFVILPAMAAAAVIAAVAILGTGSWRAPHPTRAAVGWVVGVGAAFYVGAWLMGLVPEWGLAEVRHRFLFIVLPAAIVVELIAAFAQVPRWVAWLLRAVVAAGAGLVLLHGSVYLQTWTSQEMVCWLGGLAVALLAVWSLLGLLLHVAPTLAVPLALAVVCAGGAVTIMFWGSATDGQLGLPLAAALGSAALASFLLPAPPRGAAPIGVGIVALFGLLVGGRFFAEGAGELPSPLHDLFVKLVGDAFVPDLTTVQAVVLLIAPLLCWLPQLPYLRKLKPWLRGGLCVLAVVIPVAVVVLQAEQRHTAKSQAPGSSDEWEDFYKGQPD